MDRPRIAWRPGRVQDVTALAERFSVYSDHDVAFVIFRNGTCVLSGSPQHCDDDEYLGLLAESVTGPPDFEVQTMKGMDYLVLFRGFVYGVVLREFFADHGKSMIVDAGAAALFPGEAVFLAADVQAPPEHYWAGLLSRACLHADAEDPEIAFRSS